MKFTKKNGGFTLVELIVVIAILAILAGVAIPAYSGYIEKANDAAVITQLDAIATAAQAANATVGKVSKIVVSAADGTIDITPETDTAAGSDFYLFYGSDKFQGNFTNTSYEGKGATWDGSKWGPTGG